MFEVLIKSFSYLGFFLVGLISSSTIIFPLPIYALVSVAPLFGYNPFLVAFFTSLGMTLGELTGYFVGYGSYKLLEKKIRKVKEYKKYKKYVEKYGDVVIFLFSLLPLPFDIVGIICGSVKYDIKRFLFFTFLGKFLKILAIIYGIYSIQHVFF
ncbi:MAG: VTT domain-containing protein [Candidatus Aenigmatarchaeota archaeon]